MNNIDNTFDNIRSMVINSREKVYTTVNTEMLMLYWNIGKESNQYSRWRRKS